SSALVSFDVNGRGIGRYTGERECGRMRVPCFECALRACGAFKPISDMELAFINEMKRDHLTLPAGADIIAAGLGQAELYTLYAGWAFRFKMLPDGRRQILNILLPGDLIGLRSEDHTSEL